MTTFHSTRSTTDSLTSKQAIRKGIADDGGLFVTDSLGETHVDIASLAGKSYQQIAFDVLSVLLPDYTEAELKECIDEAYGPQWSDEKITPVKPLGDDCSTVRLPRSRMWRCRFCRVSWRAPLRRMATRMRRS